MTKQTQMTYPVVVVEIPRQLPPSAWVAHSEEALIDACVPACDRAGDLYPEDAADALDVLGEDLHALVTVTREEWEAAHNGGGDPAALLGLPQHHLLAAYSAARHALRGEGWIGA